MKKLGFRWITVLAAGVMMLATACSEDKAENIYITNPSMQDITVKAGDTGTINFKAASNWTIATDTPEWLSLGSSTGAAGDQKVSYTINDSGLAFDIQDAAKVTLTTDAGSFTCTITRAARERAIKFLSSTEADAVELEFISLEDTGEGIYSGRVIVSPNCDWKLASYPEWTDVELLGAEDGAEIAGSADEAASLRFTIKADKLTTTGQFGEMTITDDSGNKLTKTLSIRFLGAEPDGIATTLSPMLRFTLDGFVYAPDWIVVTEKNAVPFSVRGVENGYQMIMFNAGEYSVDLMEGFNSWIGYDEILPEAASRAQLGEKNYELYVKGNPAPTANRTGYVAILPASIYAKLMVEEGVDGIASMMFDTDWSATPPTYTPKSEYAQYIYTIQQDGPASMKLGVTSPQAITIEDNSASNGYTCYGVMAPTEATTITIAVTLPDDKAGLLPTGVTEHTVPFTYVIHTGTWNTEKGEWEYSNEGTITAIINDYTPEATSYTLTVTIPKNTSAARTGVGEISFIDPDTEDAMGSISFGQNGVEIPTN